MKNELLRMDLVAKPDIGLRRTVQLLGPPLASRMVRPDRKETLNVGRPQTKSQVGTVTGLFVVDAHSSLTKNPNLSPGFSLPFEWQPNNADSLTLPTGLSEVADVVREALSATPASSDDLGLQLAAVLDGQDLSSLKLKAPSVGVPLLASAILTQRKATPRELVFSTGQIRIGADKKIEVLRVEGVAEKTDVVIDLAQGNECWFFVPAANFEEAVDRAKQAANFHVESIRVGEDSVNNLLSELLFRLEAPPDRERPMQEKLAYVNLPYVKRREEKRVFYLDHLVDDLARQIRNQVQDKSLLNPDRMILMLSKSYEQAVLTLLSLQPKEAMVLYTEESEEYIQQLRENLDRYSAGNPSPPRLTTHHLKLGNESALVPYCAQWLGKSGHSSVVEITAGPKPVAAMLIAAAQQVESRIIYLDHQFNGVPQVGTESIRVLDWLINREV